MKRSWKSTVSVGAVLLLAVALVAGSYLQAKRTLAAKTDDLDRAYAAVAGVERHRLALLPQLEQAVHARTPVEQAAFTRLDGVRSAVLAAGSAHAASIDANRHLDDAVVSVLRLEDQSPEQRANQDLQDVASELVGSERDLALDRRRYDLTLEDYNVYLEQFPNQLWGRLAGFQKRTDYFNPGHPVRTTEFNR